MNNNFIKEFLKRNWFILWIVLALSIIVNILIYINFSSTTSQLIEEYKKNNKLVVMLSPTGDVIPATKVSIFKYKKGLENAIVKLIINNLVLDGETITQGFQVQPNNIKQIVFNNPDLLNFYKYYLTDNAKNLLVKYLRNILSIYNNDNLPEFIKIKNITINSFLVNKNGFEVKFQADLVMNSYFKEQNKYITQQATIYGSANGFIDYQSRSIHNPLGIKINSFSITIPKKRASNGI